MKAFTKRLPFPAKQVAIAVVAACCSTSLLAEETQRYSILNTHASQLPTQNSLTSQGLNHFQQIQQRQQLVQEQLKPIQTKAQQLGFTIHKQLSTLAPVAFAELTEKQVIALRRAGFSIHPSAKMYLVEDEFTDIELQEDPLPWGIEKVNANDSWGITTGDSTKVCIVDGGMDIDHYDLASNYVDGKSLDRQNNTVDDDENSHGTHVAGTIAALENDTGVVGMAPNANLYIADVFDSNGSAYTDDILEGVDWCVGQGAQVINMSYGGSSSDANQQATYQAAYDAGVVMVAASGNAGSSSLPIYPARYSMTIAVNGTDSSDRIYNNGQQGPQIDISAPGVSITSTTINGNTGQKTGTSMAAPHVTGAVALILDAAPGISVEEVRRVLRESAVDLGANGHDNAFGAGRLDVFAALQLLDDTPDDPVDPQADFNYLISDVYTVSFTDKSLPGKDVDGNPVNLEQWSWDFGDRTTSSETNPVHTYSEEGSYNVALTVVDTSGSSHTSSQSINITDTPVPDEDEIKAGESKTVSLAKGEWGYYYFESNDPSSTQATFKTTGGNGDADLYVKMTDKPTLNSYGCRSDTPTNNENCVLDDLQQGRYYVGIYAYQAISNVSLSLQTSSSNNGCDGIPAWNASSYYTPGNRVSYQEVEYEAIWWNSNANPAQNSGTGWFDSWKKVGSCR